MVYAASLRLVAVLVLLAGCKQVFGLADPDLGPSDAALVADGARVDSVRGDGPAPDAPSFAACASSESTLVACFDFEGSTVDASASALGVSASNVSYVPGCSGWPCAPPPARR